MQTWCEPIRTQGTDFDRRAAELLAQLAKKEMEQEAADLIRRRDEVMAQVANTERRIKEARA